MIKNIQVKKIDTPDLSKYKAQKNVRRTVDIKGGFDRIVFATDQDLDGFHIRGLLVGFFEKYLPEFRDKVGMLQTPVIMYSSKGKVTGWKYSIDDSKEFTGEVTYVKGIGSWNAEDLRYIISKDGLENMIQPVKFSSLADKQLIEDWLGDDSAPRKAYIIENDFEIAKI